MIPKLIHHYSDRVCPSISSLLLHQQTTSSPSKGPLLAPSSHSSIPKFFAPQFSFSIVVSTSTFGRGRIVGHRLHVDVANFFNSASSRKKAPVTAAHTTTKAILFSTHDRETTVSTCLYLSSSGGLNRRKLSLISDFRSRSASAPLSRDSLCSAHCSLLLLN